MTSPYRTLPAVETLVQHAERHLNGDAPPRDLLVAAARDALADARRAITAGNGAPPLDALVASVAATVRAAVQPSLRPLINASGVIIQTNLGRAPLSAAALQAMQNVGAGYSNLEYDLEAGERGSRYTHLINLLCRLTGAEAALAVNNNAAAVYFVLLALAAGREVIVSRGQAVEIGGGFRIPDVLRQSGATLVEVGTTNRTYARDYAEAISAQTAMLMRIHTSNFRLVGFVHETSLHEMVQVAQKYNQRVRVMEGPRENYSLKKDFSWRETFPNLSTNHVIVLDDLGSGTLLPTAPYGLAPEPTVQECVAAGADLVTFSGDKLLGGPQAGLIVGRADLIAMLRKHPLARALRVDKTTIAGLEATLLAYLNQRAETEIPVWRMIAAQPEALRARAERLATQIGDRATVVQCSSAVGGGSLPGETLPSFAVALTSDQPDMLARQLRHGTPPVIGRIVDGRLLLDVRTVLAEQERALIDAVRNVVSSA